MMIGLASVAALELARFWNYSVFNAKASRTPGSVQFWPTKMGLSLGAGPAHETAHHFNFIFFRQTRILAGR